MATDEPWYPWTSDKVTKMPDESGAGSVPNGQTVTLICKKVRIDEL